MINNSFESKMNYGIYRIIMLILYLFLAIGFPIFFYFTTKIPGNYKAINYEADKVLTSTNWYTKGYVYTQYGKYMVDGTSYNVKVEVSGFNSPMKGVVYYNPSNPSEYKIKSNSAKFIYILSSVFAFIGIFVLIYNLRNFKQ